MFYHKKLRAILLFKFATWCVQERFSSVNIPINLVAFSLQSFPILVRGMLLISIFVCAKLTFLCLGFIIMYLVLPAFNDNLFAQNHLNKSLMCLFESENNCFMFELDVYGVVSSANDNIFVEHDSCISFTYIKYNKGPIIDPWDTPHRTLSIFDLWFSIVTDCCLFSR